MTISARLVELLEGRIWVESEVGRGSEFHFTIRMGLCKGSPVRHLPEKPANLEGLRVLVVDDNATNRRILEKILVSWRMSPSSADGGQTALEMLAEARDKGAPFRLLILDVNMPLMDGFEVAERIRAQPEYNGLPSSYSPRRDSVGTRPAAANWESPHIWANRSNSLPCWTPF